jgi:glycosyltransferase involved in cell wall biosynthesis
MTESSIRRAPIGPPPPGLARPLWSVMIPVYNARSELRRSLASVLACGRGPAEMQIHVVDDHSTDNPKDVVDELGGGRVEFHRQPFNVGHARNFNTCLERARGHLVHVLHADDRVAEPFYMELGRLFESHAEIGAAFCRHAIVDAQDDVIRLSPLEREQPGILEGWLNSIAAELRLQPPSIAVRREVYERLGGFDTRLVSCGEDWEMWVRIAAHYPVAFQPQVLAFYTDSTDSLTKRSIRSGQNIRDVRTATWIARTYLRDEAALAANRRALESWAAWAVHWAWHLVERHEFRAAGVQLREALLCSRSAGTLRAVARVTRFGAAKAVRLAARKVRLA